MLKTQYLSSKYYPKIIENVKWKKNIIHLRKICNDKCLKLLLNCSA